MAALFAGGNAGVDDGGIEMEEYIKLLLEQIRCRKVHPYIEQEIRGHLEEQTEDFIRQGMSREEAEHLAVLDMGDPAEAGASLDRIHRPKIAWSTLLLVKMLAIFAVLIQAKIRGEFGGDRFLLHTFIGILAMSVITLADYRLLARYAKIAAGLIAATVIYFIWRGGGNLASIGAIQFGGLQFSLFHLLMLYIPLYGALLYDFRGTGYGGLLQSAVWMLIPVISVFFRFNFSTGALLLFSLSFLLAFAVREGWFAVSKKMVLAAAAAVNLSFIGVFFLGLGAGSFDWSGRLQDFYQMKKAQEFVRELSGLFVSGGEGIREETMQFAVQMFSRDFLLVYLSEALGIFAAAALCLLFAVLLFKVFSTALGQKDPLGRILGCGCGLVFLMNFLLYLFGNLGILPMMQTFLPFFSAGGSGLLLSYALTGLVLSIYRHKDLPLSKFLKNCSKVTKVTDRKQNLY